MRRYLLIEGIATEAGLWFVMDSFQHDATGYHRRSRGYEWFDACAVRDMFEARCLEGRAP